MAFVLASIELTSSSGEITSGHFQESLLVLKLSSIDFFLIVVIIVVGSVPRAKKLNSNFVSSPSIGNYYVYHTAM